MTKRTILFVIAVFLPIAFALSIHYGTIDGIRGFIFSLMFREDTQYTQGYTEAGFKKITPGMTVEQVHAILGPPHDRWNISPKEEGTVFAERWSWSPGDTHYRYRTIRYRNNSVERVLGEFYVD
jgi:hypothetical protein